MTLGTKRQQQLKKTSFKRGFMSMKKNHFFVFVSVVFASNAPDLVASSPSYAGHAVLTPRQKEIAVEQCAIKRQSVQDLYGGFLNTVRIELKKNMPYLNDGELQTLADVFAVKYPANPKVGPIGLLVLDLTKNLDGLEAKIEKDPKATVEDSAFYGSQCGSLGTGITGGIKDQQKNVPQNVSAFLNARYCPAALTNDQLKAAQKDNQFKIGTTVFYVSKTASGLTGLVAGFGLSKAVFDKMRTYAGSSDKTMACDYKAGKATIQTYYIFKDLSQIKPFS